MNHGLVVWPHSCSVGILNSLGPRPTWAPFRGSSVASQLPSSWWVLTQREHLEQAELGS